MPRSISFARRRPKQKRSRFTRNAIFEATAQILEADGEASLTTNKIAERAGVSVGTIYQYFSDKNAILVEMARLEAARIEQLTRKIRADGIEMIDATRLAIRSYIQIFADRPKTRRAALRAILETEPTAETGTKTDRTAYALPAPSSANRIDAFVVTRAVVGVVRAAVLEEFRGLQEPEFEDALVHLVEAYRRAPFAG